MGRRVTVRAVPRRGARALATRLHRPPLLVVIGACRLALNLPRTLRALANEAGPAGVPTQLPSSPCPGPARATLQALNASFRRTLEQENKSPRTIEADTDAVRLLAAFREANGLPAVARDLERDDIRAFVADQLAQWKPTTAHQRYRSLRTFFKWGVSRTGDRKGRATWSAPHCSGSPAA